MTDKMIEESKWDKSIYKQKIKQLINQAEIDQDSFNKHDKIIRDARTKGPALQQNIMRARDWSKHSLSK